MFELHIKPCHVDSVEEISERLLELGALSITLVDEADEPILEPAPGETPLWQHSILHALFESHQDATNAWLNITSIYKNLSHNIAELPDTDWVRVSNESAVPLCFGKTLWICPSNHTPPHADKVNLMLDPGLAFGTGSHPTTALCLKWLDSMHGKLAEKTVIDYGCGSGILALAALKLGAKHLSAVDIDEQALTATRDNAMKNAIDEHVLSLGFPESLDTPVDILIANILLGPLKTLENRFHQLLKSGGILALSGILKTQVDELKTIYCTPKWSLLDTQTEEDWALVLLKKI